MVSGVVIFSSALSAAAAYVLGLAGTQGATSAATLPRMGPMGWQ